MIFFGKRLVGVVCAASAVCLFSQPAHAIVAGNPNPPTGADGLSLYPADSPNNPYNPVTQTGHLDMLGLASPFSGVGQIDQGTGTLLDSTHVLTAAHLFRNGSDPTGISFNLDSGTGTMSFAASRIDICPQFRGVVDNDAGDLAIVTLSTPVPATFRTYSLYTGALTSGTTLTLVGYGESGNGVTGYSGGAGVRRVGKNNADAALLPGGGDNNVDPTLQPGNQTYLFDFDSPDGDTASAPNVLGGTSLGNDVETTLGNGDSGGPGFILVGGQYEIAALNNFLVRFGPDSNLGPNIPLFGSGGGGPIVSGYTSFLAGFVPAPEPAPWAALGLGGLLLAGRMGLHRRKN